MPPKLRSPGGRPQHFHFLVIPSRAYVSVLDICGLTDVEQFDGIALSSKKKKRVFSDYVNN